MSPEKSHGEGKTTNPRTHCVLSVPFPAAEIRNMQALQWGKEPVSSQQQMMPISWTLPVPRKPAGAQIAGSVINLCRSLGAGKPYLFQGILINREWTLPPVLCSRNLPQGSSQPNKLGRV